MFPEKDISAKHQAGHQTSTDHIVNVDPIKITHVIGKS